MTVSAAQVVVPRMRVVIAFYAAADGPAFKEVSAFAGSALTNASARS